MTFKSVYNELVIDLVENCKINSFDARKIVRYLDDEGFLDYDLLKEHYAEEDEETD